MKKARRIILIAVISVALITVLGIVLYNLIVDEYALSINEKKWIDNNTSSLITVAVPNDLPVFGDQGEGVFFDFTNYLSNKVGLNINNNTLSYLTETSGYGFYVGTSYDASSLLLYSDHYVLVSSKTGLFTNTAGIVNLKAGVLSSNLSQVTAYFNTTEDKFASYTDYDKITADLTNGTLSYALVPLTEYKNELIANNINILSHISDLNKYFYFRLSDNNTINSIITKKFNSWKDREFEDSYNKHDYTLFINNLKITDEEEATLKSKTYKYGFTENRPYELLANGEYGGITAEYIRMFSQFSGVDFTYKKYRNGNELAASAIVGKIDLFYNYYNKISNYIDCGALNQINYYVIADNSIDLTLSNISGLSNKTVYVLKDSYLYELIKDIEGINIKTYEKSFSLKSIVRKKAIILIDENTYHYYLNGLENSYSIRYAGSVSNNYYSFRYQNDNDTFYRLFNSYTKTINPADLLRKGITSYNSVDRTGKIIIRITAGVLIIIAGAFFVIVKDKKKVRKVKIDTRVRKEDRLKFIDMLTSLKNRNYYNEKLNSWNKNRIYPQTCLVLDINNVKELNDSYGHEEGDKQIQAVANILVKTQIDNTEIIRTDGNEFLIYMVGYSEKQVLSYMKKLVKEFKNLPHETGVAMGFSMIEDDTKLVEDAFNEASIQMRENKVRSEELSDGETN